jgi:acyl-coenzyme A thioesterase 13
MKSADLIPEGFELVQRPRPNPFNDMVGPFYEKRAGKSVVLGLRIEERHCNSRGICHGGLLATLADLSLGYAALAAGSQSSFVTVNLALDFAGSARAGDWVHSEAQVQRAGSRLAFVSGYLLVSEERIVRASAVFAFSGGLAKAGGLAKPASATGQN